MKAAAGRTSSNTLQSSSVYVRVLPEHCCCGHIDQDGDDADAAKKLCGWTESTIQLEDRHGRETYDFPSKVLGPDVNQEDAYAAMGLPALVEQCTQGYNVLFFAYGQTGTGKTHTIFGPNSALETGTLHPDWGVFPRVVDDILKRIKSNNSRCLLFASALEFYLGRCRDLLDDQYREIMISEEFAPQGHTLQRIDSTLSLVSFLAAVRAHRTVRSTRMNERTKESEGSSRSHCALMLTLMQVDSDNTYRKTTFTIVDFAGAERPDKTGEERRSGMDLMMELYLGKEVSTGSQGFLINYELFQIRTAVIQATEQHVKKRPYAPPKQCVTMIQQFIGSCLDGRALLGMVITISQAARNGWETWFTMQYGTDLSKLRAPCRPEPSTPIAKALKSLETAKLRALELLSKTPKSGTPASKYYSKREVVANDMCRECDHLIELSESCTT